MLLSLVAHAGGYRMMVDAHNTVGCQMHVGGYVVLRGFTMFIRYGKSQRPQHYRCPEACGGSLTVWGFNGAHNTVGEM